MSPMPADITDAYAAAIDRATDGVTFDRWIDGGASPAASGETFSPRDPAVDEPTAPLGTSRPAASG